MEKALTISRASTVSYRFVPRLWGTVVIKQAASVVATTLFVVLGGIDNCCASCTKCAIVLLPDFGLLSAMSRAFMLRSCS